MLFLHRGFLLAALWFLPLPAIILQIYGACSICSAIRHNQGIEPCRERLWHLSVVHMRHCRSSRAQFKSDGISGRYALHGRNAPKAPHIPSFHRKAPTREKASAQPPVHAPDGCVCCASSPPTNSHRICSQINPRLSPASAGCTFAPSCPAGLAGDPWPLDRH